MKILAIETSCDETAVSVVEATGGLQRPKFKILSHVVSSQVELHAEWGGVVPNLAKREHERNLVPLVGEALSQAGLIKAKPRKLEAKDRKKIEVFLVREPELQNQLIPFLESVSAPKIDAIAVTRGPGLEPALWVGINGARALSYAWQKPLVPTNHMEGHIVSPLADPEAKIAFPALALLVSGGHTELVLMKDWLKRKVIGKTRDDAVGEAFDKVARMLGLPYPGGPAVSRLAALHRQKYGKTDRYVFPRPMLHSGNFDFSFSGLKTAVLYTIKKQLSHPTISTEFQLSESDKQEIARGFEDAAIDVLTAKTAAALKKTGARSLIIGGGVIANAALREAFARLLTDRFPGVSLLVPEFKLATDNATMIAMAAYLRTQDKEHRVAPKVVADGNLQLK